MKALTASLLVALASCGPAVNQNDNTRAAPGTFLITAEQIEKSGAHTAWQVLKQHAPMLTMREDRNGRPVSACACRTSTRSTPSTPSRSSRS